MSVIYSRAKQEAVDRAVAKAKAVKPLVKITGYGEFEVEGLGEKYTVKFSKHSGEFTATCGCKANKFGSICYHVVACSGILKKQVNDRAAAKNIWARWEAVEANEAAHPEPEHTKYEQSIAEAKAILFG